MCCIELVCFCPCTRHCACAAPRGCCDTKFHMHSQGCTDHRGSLPKHCMCQGSYCKAPALSSTCRFQNGCLSLRKNVCFEFSPRTGIFSASMVLWAIVAKILIKILLRRNNTIYNKNTSFTIHYSIKRLNVLVLKN